MRLKRSAEDIVAIGQELREAKRILPHGAFGEWLASEFEMNERTARRFMEVAERFENISDKMSDFNPSVLYLLAASSTPDTVVERVVSGEIEATATAIREAKVAERSARDEAAQARYEAQAAHQAMVRAEESARLDTQRAAEARARP